MTHLVDQPIAQGMAAEWQRIELLAHCLSQSRQSRVVGQPALDRLRELQSIVTDGRINGAWSCLMSSPLTELEYDVLACVIAPEVEPRLGWLYQSLQAGMPQPYPTLALLHDLLAFDSAGMVTLYEVLDDRSRLRCEHLIEYERLEPYQPVRPGPTVTMRLLGRSHHHAPPGAVLVNNNATWDDLILSSQRIAMLREFLYWVQHRETVIDRWGGINVGGPIALFTGPSGTGKTWAASVLANVLGWPLYRVDLGRLISKYIGETEENLNRLFDAAHGRPMVLQFDEADSVFGKRGEIKEARDRYANMEVSHLLARVESHQGPCILTTNLRGNLDPAFVRRFQIVVEFTRPDEAARTKLWWLLLPRRAPGRNALDLSMLGRAVNLTGGEIRNAALHAAHMAAAANSAITYNHIALAVWRELAKDGRELSIGDLGALAPYLNVEVTQ
ncbi:MAG: ATP-binding protein [Planctomycetota bacterium]|jgi:hypothetical protein